MSFMVLICCLVSFLCVCAPVQCTVIYECDNRNYMSCFKVDYPEGHNPYLEAVNNSPYMRQRAHGYLQVRPGAHLFYQLLYANGTKQGSENKPLIIWIQGGPGFAASGIANFAELGPLDMNFKPRNHTWVKNRNVLLIDHPVGVGFSYFTKDSLVAHSDREVVMDLAKAVKVFLRKRKEFRKTPTYIIGQSYGGKICTRLALYLYKAIKDKGLKMNLKGVGIGGGWVNPRESILMQPEFLYLTGSIDRSAYLTAKNISLKLAHVIDRREFFDARPLDSLLFELLYKQGNINFNNVNTFAPYEALNFLGTKINLYVKPTLTHVNQSIEWNYMSSIAYDSLKSNFVVPSYAFLEKLLNISDIKVVIYNGNLDVVTPVAGASNWVHKLRWTGSANFAKAPRRRINGNRNGYFKVWKQLSFWTVFGAGHWVPEENPVAMEHILDYLTTDAKIDLYKFDLLDFEP